MVVDWHRSSNCRNPVPDCHVPKAPTLYGVTMRFATGGEPAGALSNDYDRYYAWLSSEYIANGLADIAASDTFASMSQKQLSENAFDNLTRSNPRCNWE